MAAKMKPTKKNDIYKMALPASLKVEPDEIELQLDFYHESIVMRTFTKTGGEIKTISARDMAHALANELSWSSGLLPQNTLWWSNTKEGPLTAIYMAPHIRKLALQTEAGGKPKRYTLPLPGLIFLCSPGKPPWVYAVKTKPVGIRDEVFKAPLCNVYDTGRTCPGTNKYPQEVGGVPESFLISFFTRDANINKRSKKHQDDISKMWKDMDGLTEYPLDDLVKQGTIKDLMSMELAES